MILKKIALGLLAGVALGASAQAADIDHVLLISVDGLHALDVARFVDAHPNSALAELSGHGITYSNARTPANSDSFPGLLALVTAARRIPTACSTTSAMTAPCLLRTMSPAKAEPAT